MITPSSTTSQPHLAAQPHRKCGGKTADDGVLVVCGIAPFSFERRPSSAVRSVAAWDRLYYGMARSEVSANIREVVTS